MLPSSPLALRRNTSAFSFPVSIRCQFKGKKPDNMEAIGLSWQPKLPSFSSTKNDKSSSNEAETSALYKPNSQLIDGLFVPPNDPRKLNKLLKKQVKDTAGKNWFDMPAQTITPELKKDLQLLKVWLIMLFFIVFLQEFVFFLLFNMGLESLPDQVFEVGTVIESASEFFTGRLTKKERKATLADELLSDGNLGQYRKRKVREIEDVNRPGGMDKWKISKSRKHGKAGNRNGKKRRH
ncbi:hypothetical protein BUALT_Bualt03G0165100 [Buddleja alternifolia]|uniref:Fcf2 pre-rRNA processing C-terminal domain-containing protein n=1 Tax=Buddleja alternifolia TaxID=168488 RepID=A0AAV6Y1L0_9LAMI|nr:hypothetical protein BUALT_Bualt03G0165100 [Buddleja alternifolia]